MNDGGIVERSALCDFGHESVARKVVGENSIYRSVFIIAVRYGIALRACTDGKHRQQKSRKMLHANVYLGLYLCRLSFFE